MHTVPDAIDMVVLRGPKWLFVSLHGDAFDGNAWSTLARRLQRLLDRHLRCHLILDLNRAPRLSGELIGQMVTVQGWIDDRRGVMRVCGLSAEVAAMFRSGRLDRIFCVYPDIRSAVQGGRRFRERRAVAAKSRPACKVATPRCRNSHLPV